MTTTPMPATAPSETNTTAPEGLNLLGDQDAGSCCGGSSCGG